METGTLRERWNGKALFRLIWPLMVGQVLVVTMGTVDTLMVSSVSMAAMSGVSLVDSINLLLINIFYALSVGSAVVVSQYIGRGDAANASLAAKQLVYAVTAGTLLLMSVSLLLRRAILGALYGHIAEDVMQSAETYMWLSALSYPFIGLQNGLAALFRCMGNSKVGMMVSLLVNIVNILGNSLFIYGMHMGVGGAALATLLSRAAAAVVLFVLILRHNTGPVSLAGISRVRLHFGMIRKILSIGVPGGVENGMFQIGKILVARVVSTFGTAAIAGNTVGNLVGNYATLPGMAFSMALMTLVGQFVGARDYEGAKQIVRKLLAAAYILLLPLNLLLLALSGVILPVFHLDETGAEVARQALWIFCLSMPLFWVTGFVLPNALRAAADTRYTLAVSIFSMWLCRVGGAYLLAYTMGFAVAGVWLAMALDWAVRSVFFVLRWLHGRWQTKRLID